MLPQLRGLWMMSTVDSGGLVYDASGLTQTLSQANTPTYGVQGLVPYVNLDVNQALYRTDEANLSMTGALTQLTWIQFHTDMTGIADYFYSKYLELGDNCSYMLYKPATNKFTFGVSDNGKGIGGANWFTVDDVGVNYVINKWFFVVGRYTPSTEVALFVNNHTTRVLNKYTNVTTIPASIKDGTAELAIGRGNGTNYHDGYVAVSALCAAALSDTTIKALFAHSRALFGVH
jgi:hypothetical protein